MNFISRWLNKRRYSKIIGITPQLKDIRDYKYKPTIKKELETIDLRKNSPYIKNQRNTNACTGFGITALFEHEILEKLNLKRQFSPLFVWYNARVLEGKKDKNEGVYLRNIFKVVLDKGLVYEKSMPFKPNYLRVPDNFCWNLGKMFKNLLIKHKCKYSTVIKSDINKCLSESNPIVFGMRVNNSFYNNKDGFIESINPTGGGHCMTAFGYIMIEGIKWYIVKNSWGSRSGDRGYFYIEESYLKKHGFDFWTVQLEE